MDTFLESFTILLILFLSKLSFAQDCYPEGKAGVVQYVIGYGSLLSTASKNRSVPNTGPNIPVRVKGYTRLWNCRGESPSLSTTYLGAVKNPRGQLNAAVFSLDNGHDGLFEFDQREHFYCRSEVKHSDIQILSSKTVLDPAAQYWIYVTKISYASLPSPKYPIVESYVDTFLVGCLEMQDHYGIRDFAKECIRTTLGWSPYWVNDRIFPRRPFMYQPKSKVIDTLLQSLVPNYFRSIRIE